MALARDRIILPGDVTTAASTNYTPITGLSFAVTVGWYYHVKAVVNYTVAATTTGLRLGLSANPTTAIAAGSAMDWGPNGIGTIDGGGHDDFVTTASTTGGATAKTDSPDTTIGNIHFWEATIKAPATAVWTLEAGPEAAAAVTFPKFMSYLEWELLAAP